MSCTLIYPVNATRALNLVSCAKVFDRIFIIKNTKTSYLLMEHQPLNIPKMDK